MKTQALIVGNKYVPTRKTVGCGLDCSGEWRNAQKMNQPFLYYTGMDQTYHCFSYNYTPGEVHGDFFSPEDVIPYSEKTQTMKNANFKPGTKVRVIGNTSGHGQEIGKLLTIEGIGKLRTIEKDPTRVSFDSYSVQENTMLYAKGDLEPVAIPVSVEFVKAAHAAACKDWKKRVEEELPELFVKEKTYSIGDRFVHLGEEYILARVSSNTINAINLTNGNRWSESVSVENDLAVTAQELAMLIDDSFTQIKK